MNDEMREALTHYLDGKGYLAAIAGLVDVFDEFHTLPGAIHDISNQVKSSRIALERLTNTLQRAVTAAKRIEQQLPPPQGLDRTYAVERSLVPRLVAVLDDVKAVTPRSQGGRPKSIGEEKLTLAVWGVLLRADVPESRIFAIAQDCLMMMGFDVSDRVVNQVRKLTKTIKK